MNITAEIGKRIQAALSAKDFNALGGILKKYKIHGKMVKDVAKWLSAQNPQFDEDRFMEFVGSFYGAAKDEVPPEFKEQWEKNKKESSENKRRVAERLVSIAERLAGEVPPEFKEQWKNKDKDGDGKTNEPKPDFLKDKKEAFVSRRQVAEELMSAAELLAGEVQWKKDKKDDGEKKASENVLSFSVPLLIRIMEYSKEDAETDMDLHVAVENMLRLGADGAPMTMADYDDIVGGTPDGE
jgi:hypothetical protein